MHGIAQFHKQAHERVLQVIQESRALKPEKRAEVLRAELDASVAERKLLMTESLSLLFGGGTTDMVTEDPRFDDGEVWDETGLTRGATWLRRQGRRNMTMRDLSWAREVCRALVEENEYVIGSLENRIAYTVGEGLIWRAVPRDRMAADSRLTAAANDALEAFRDAEFMDLIEQEWVKREDRDGEAIPRLFANADGPLQFRFVEPEQLGAPPELPGGLPQRALHALSLGVEVEPRDVRTVLAYWIAEDATEQPKRVQAFMPELGIRHVHHSKLNVDLSDPRGWPTYWPIRRNMARAEKLLRNMSYVAALQAAIALIRKHEGRSQSEVEALLDRSKDLSVSNSVTGKTTRYRGVGPGTVIDGGPGVSYEAPVSSVNAANNVTVLDADLAGAAMATGQPTFMFTGKVSGGYASELVAEGPHHKGVKRRQGRLRRHLQAIHWDALRHEVFWGRLDPAVLTRYKLEVDFPDPLVRDHLQQTQRYQIMHGAGVISRHTWRAREGLSPDEEERHMDREAAKGHLDARKGEEVSAGAKPAPGSTPGGPGGADMRGNPDSPETTATQRF